MGLFDTWKVANITTSASKSSHPFYLLAQVIEHSEVVEVPKEMLHTCAIYFLKMNESFDEYFDGGIKKEKIDAVKFLVAFSSYVMGKDKMGWDWQQVRHASQGLYGSMEESPAHFLHYNSPLIATLNNNVKNYTINNF